MNWVKTTARWNEKHLSFGIYTRGLTVCTCFILVVFCCEWVIGLGQGHFTSIRAIITWSPQCTGTGSIIYPSDSEVTLKNMGTYVSGLNISHFLMAQWKQNYQLGKWFLQSYLLNHIQPALRNAKLWKLGNKKFLGYVEPCVYINSTFQMITRAPLYLQ